MDLIVLSLAKKYANKKFSEVVKFGGFEIVDILPDKDISTSTVYLKKSTTQSQGDIYEEFVYTTTGWERLGTTVDLHGYITEEALNEALKQISWDDLKDRPFGSTVVTEKLVYSYRLPFDGRGVATLPDVAISLPADNYLVVFDNIDEFYCDYVPITNWAQHGAGQLIDKYGKVIVLRDDYNGNEGESDYTNFYYKEGTHQIDIYEATEELTTIDTKYLPMEEIVSAVIEALPNAEDERI